MTPHKDPANLPVDDQLKLLRHTTDDTNSKVTYQGMRLRSVENQVQILRTEVKDVKTEVRGVKSEVKSIGKKLDKLYTLVVGFAGRVKGHDEEISILNNRTSESRKNIDKLNSAVFTT